MYLVQSELDGTCRTVIAFTPRSAMERFVAEYRPPKGERYRVKPRGHGEWEIYSVN